jgi:hypothetical protein
VEEPARVEEPRAQPAAVEPQRASVARVDPKEILSSAGLQMVETDRSKAIQPAPEPEPIQLGRPRRERPAPAATEEVSLVQVETRNK